MLFAQLRLVLVLLLLPLAACAARGPNGPVVRFAQATPADLAAVEEAPEVWYHFVPGDRFPVIQLFAGMAEASSGPTEMVVKREFYLVRKNGKIFFSFDGQRLVQNPFSRWAMIVGEGEAERGSIGVLQYVGPANEAPAGFR